MMSSRTLIREAIESDLPSILAIFNDIVANSTAIYEVNKRTLEEQKTWYQEKVDGGFPVFVAEVHGKVVAYGHFGPFRKYSCYSSTVEHGLHVSAPYRNQGIGSNMLEHLIENAKARGLHAMIAGIDSGNEGSIRLHKRFGFKIMGKLPQVARKFSKWLDLTFMQLKL